MEIDIKSAKKEVQEVYAYLKPMVKDVVSKHSKEIDNIIDKVKKNATTMDNRELQNYMLQLQIEAYYFAEGKDLSVLMQECALAVSKEKQADIFNSTAGTQAVRSNQAIIESMDKQTVVLIQNAVANSMKSKLDETHRMISVLSNILISRNAENKLKGATDNAGNLPSNGISENGTDK